MKKIVGVLLVLFISCGGFLIAEEAKKANPARDFRYDLKSDGTGVVITGYRGKDVEVIIPSVIKTFPVVEIGNNAFENSNLESITIPDSVKNIESYAFYSCKNLKTVVLGNGVESIKFRVFSETALESITIPDSVKSIERYAFYYCESLKTVTIGNGVESIDSYAFSGSNLESIIIPDSVKSIESYAFYYCESLKTVTIGNGVKSIGYSAFEYCKSLSDESKEKIKALGYTGRF